MTLLLHYQLVSSRDFSSLSRSSYCCQLVTSGAWETDSIASRLSDEFLSRRFQFRPRFSDLFCPSAVPNELLQVRRTGLDLRPYVGYCSRFRQDVCDAIVWLRSQITVCRVTACIHVLIRVLSEPRPLCSVEDVASKSLWSLGIRANVKTGQQPILR